MSSPHSQLNSGVCVVGYALNAKKLRKSSHDRSLVSDCSPISGHAKTFASNSETAPKRKLSDVEACYIEHEWKGGGLADILESNSSSSPAGKDRSAVLFVQLDHEIPLENQPKCHVIIHKLTEDIDNKSKDSVAKIKSLDAYLQHNPDTVIVDPLLAVRKVISRARTCEHLSIIQRQMQGKCPFTQPAYGIVKESASTEDIVRQISDLRFCYPLICKPIQACGTPNSHNMVIIVSEADLGMMTTPCVVQQYHDHDNILYKVYVMDDDVMVFRRQSLPNLYIGCGRKGGSTKSAELRSVTFDSRKPYPTYSDFVDTEKANNTADKGADEDVPPPPRLPATVSTDTSLEIDSELQDKFEAAAAAIRAEFGLSLFGFDAIIPRTSLPCTSSVANGFSSDMASSSLNGVVHANVTPENCLAGSASSAAKIVVIDVNYFPSYKEVRDFPTRLKRFLRSKMKSG